MSLFLAIASLIVDVVILFRIIIFFTEKSDNRRKLELAQQKREEDTAWKAYEQEKVLELEKQKRELGILRNRYAPMSVVQYTLTKSSLKISDSVNTILKNGVEDLFKDLQIKYSAASKINAEILNFTSRKYHPSIASELEYLREHEQELLTLKENSDRAAEEILCYKIKLLNEDKTVVESLRSSLTAVKLSEKHNAESVSIDDFFPAVPKVDIGMFAYNVKPMILHVGGYYILLFSRVIIVLDNHSAFVTALQPNSLKISIEHKSRSVFVLQDSKKITDDIIGTDSKKLAEGMTRYRWVHQRNDGMPDRRYTDNPVTISRNDTYEYGIVTFSIAGHDIVYTISSESALSMLKAAAENYCVSYDGAKDIPATLLSLLGQVSDNPTDNDNILDLQAMYKTIHPQTNYFYEIVTSDTNE